MNVVTVNAAIDARMLAALHDVPDDRPLEEVAARAGVEMATLRESMRRLALRTTEGPDGSAAA